MRFGCVVVARSVLVALRGVLFGGCFLGALVVSCSFGFVVWVLCFFWACAFLFWGVRACLGVGGWGFFSLGLLFLVVALVFLGVVVF